MNNKEKGENKKVGAERNKKMKGRGTVMGVRTLKGKKKKKK
jgi:hypothetical protein